MTNHYPLLDSMRTASKMDSAMSISTMIKLNQLMKENEQSRNESAILASLSARARSSLATTISPTMESYISHARQQALYNSPLHLSLSRPTVDHPMTTRPAPPTLSYHDLTAPTPTGNGIPSILLRQGASSRRSSTTSSAVLGSELTRRRAESLGSLPNTSSSSLATQESKPAVRKEKIIEALKSENQRGKKRQDLNDMERLELTRTRNREHAKSTRLRKKARYDELLKFEEHMQSILKTNDLREERENCVQNFLSVRQDMLNKKLSRAPVKDDDASLKDGDDLIRSLEEVIINPIENFRFRVEGPTSFDCGDGHSNSSLSCMEKWDRELRFEVEQAHPTPNAKVLPFSSTSHFAYELQDGKDSIAISDNGNGYAHMDLVLHKKMKMMSSSATTCTTQKIVVMSAVLKVRFDDADQPNRLSSVVVLSMTSSLSPLSATALDKNTAISGDNSSDEKSAMGVQQTHPSVISLSDQVCG